LPFFFFGIDDEGNGASDVVVIVDADKLSEVIVSSDLVNGSTSGFDVTTSVSSNSRSQLSPETVSLSVRVLFGFSKVIVTGTDSSSCCSIEIFFGVDS